jgi:non-specific serine/threonine protein kinase
VSKKIETDSTFIMGVGSPAYMSPEQVKGYPLNQKTDLYSLGVVLFHLLTGRLPFRATNPAQLIYKIINADPPAVSQLNPDMPELIDAVIRKALEKDLYSRYKNGAEFAKDLAAVRYKIVDDRYVPPDTSRFSMLRKLRAFTEFDDIELWEVLRISTWRKADERTTLMRERDADQRFGIVLEGEVEISVDGRRVARYGPGEFFGELAWLDSIDHRHLMSVVAVTATTYLEINPAALALATDEVRELFRTLLSTVVAKRLGAAARELAKQGEPAVRGDFTATGGLDLQLVDD